MDERKGIFNASKDFIRESRREEFILRKHQETRHVSFASDQHCCTKKEECPTPSSEEPNSCVHRSLSERIARWSNMHDLTSVHQKNPHHFINRRMTCEYGSLALRTDLANSLTDTGIEKGGKKKKMRNGSSSDLESSRKRPSFVVSLAPVLRQWSKFASAIGTVTTPSLDHASGLDADEREPTSEDLFLKRFSTRYLALSSRCSMSAENNHARKISKNTFSDRDQNGNEKERGKFWLAHKCIWARTISPDGAFVFYWLSLVTLGVLYNWWTLIVRQCFKELITGDATGVWFIFDTVSDLLLLLDIFVQLRTGYLEQGLLVVDAKKLAKRYFWSTQFVLDSLSLTPLDYFVNIYHPILRFPRLLKTYRAVKFYYMLESRTVYPNAIRVANWCHILLLACHWFACFHFMVAGMAEFRPRSHWTEWTKESVDNTSLTRKYLLSLYWSTLTLTTIGTTAAPGTEYEYLFTIISYLIGVFVFAAIVGQVGNVITNRNARRLEFERLSDGAKQYMRYHKVPKDMQRRVQQWFDYSWSRGRMTGNADTHALSVLPDKLKTELALRVNLNTLRKVTMFQECQPQFLHDLVLKMRAVIFTPGDIVCRKGEVAREMYIIADGVLEVLNEDGEVIRVMKAGDFFGEIGILNLDSGLNKRTADVRSVGYSELFCLSREDVLAATKDYPDAEAILREHGQRRLQNPFSSRPSRIMMSHCSKESLDSCTTSTSRRQSTIPNELASPTRDQMIQPPLSPAAMSTKWHNIRRGQRQSHSERSPCDVFHFLTNDHQRNRSYSLANVLVANTKPAAPSHVTNLLGCPVVNEGSRLEMAREDSYASNSYHQTAPNLSIIPTIDSPVDEYAISKIDHTCNEEMAALKSALHNFVCPQVYVNVIHEVHTAQQLINSKLRILADRLRRTEFEAAVLRHENARFKDTGGEPNKAIRSQTSSDIRMLH